MLFRSSLFFVAALAICPTFQSASYADCPLGEIQDCNGNCAPAEWVGDGLCDDGSFANNSGDPIFFNCSEFDCDGGDCAPDDCSDGEAAPGACCIGSSTCEDITAEQCATLGGLYLGDGVSCLTNVCPETSAGACCIGTACLKIPEAACAELGATFLAELDCADASCEVDLGICCLPGSVCLEISPSDCEMLQGRFIHDTTGLGCARNDIPCVGGPPCPEGHVSDCNGNCFPEAWLGNGTCDNHEQYLGRSIDLGCAETGFDLGDCGNPVTLGACCLHIGCLGLSHEDCLASGGQFLGTEVDCFDLPCGPTLQGDFNNNKEIDIEDLLATISGYGLCDPDSPLPCNGDSNLDGNVDINDILETISRWSTSLPFAVREEVVIYLDDNGEAQVPDFSQIPSEYIQAMPGEVVLTDQQPPAHTTVYSAGDVPGSVVIERFGETYQREVLFRVEDNFPPRIEPRFEYVENGATCYDTVAGVPEIDGEQTIIRTCSPVRLLPDAFDNADPHPLLRVYVGDTEVNPGYEIDIPGHHVIRYLAEDEHGNKSDRVTFLELNPIPLMKGEAAVTQVECAYDPVSETTDFDLTLAVLPATLGTSISDLTLSSATLILTDEYGSPVDLDNDDVLRISGSHDFEGNYSPETTEASFQDGWWQLRFRSSDPMTGEFYSLADCPVYGEFVATVRAGEPDEFEISARFPITAVSPADYVAYQDGFDGDEEDHDPEPETASCKCSFKSKWIRQRFLQRPLDQRVNGQDPSWLERYAGLSPFDWQDEMRGMEGSGRSNISAGSQTAISTYGYFRVWNDGHRRHCKSEFAVESRLRVKNKFFLSPAPRGLGRSFVQVGGLLAVDTSLGGAAAAKAAGMTRWNYTPNQIGLSESLPVLRIQNRGGSFSMVRESLLFENEPALVQGVHEQSDSDSETVPATEARRLDVGVSVSSIAVAQLHGGSGVRNQQDGRGFFKRDRLKVTIEGRWLATECETVDFDRILDGTEVDSD
ncbi:MAG: hypothetical protein VX527_02840 [Planctomycetota bacterium]|nr:hypothetical protein [Planctomycetota bacterium]